MFTDTTAASHMMVRLLAHIGGKNHHFKHSPKQKMPFSLLPEVELVIDARANALAPALISEKTVG